MTSAGSRSGWRAAAFLRRAGHEVVCVDDADARPDGAGPHRRTRRVLHLPMHTATRHGAAGHPVPAPCESGRPSPYGLYAPLNAALLRERGVQTVLGPEFEADSLALASGLAGGDAERPAGDARADWVSARVPFIQPDRAGLPPLSSYASLQVGDRRKTVGYTEATRGCKHRCRHCPIVPIYDGRFRAVPVDVVLADVRAQVAAGAEHITFGDPDFFNGPTHAMRIVDEMARACPGVSYDVTIKVEHLRAHAGALTTLRDTGCAFVTTAVESFDDEVLARLDKGHTHADFQTVVAHCASIGWRCHRPSSPSRRGRRSTATWRCWSRRPPRLAGHVAPIQYAIRLLVPRAPACSSAPDMRARIEASTRRRWRMSGATPIRASTTLQRQLRGPGRRAVESAARRMFAAVWDAAHAAADRRPPAREPLVSRATIPAT